MKYLFVVAFLFLIQFAIAQVPATPGAISGSASVCIGSSPIYSILPVSGATSYTWTVPAGWTGTSTSPSIQVNVGVSSGAIQVTANNGFGSSAVSTLAITVKATPVITISPTGPLNFCPTTAGVTVNANVIPGITYQWFQNGLPIPSAQNPSYYITGGTNYQVVITQNGCSDSSSIITVVNNPAPPKPTITAGGSLRFCEGKHVLLSTNATSNIIWSNGANSSQIWANTSGNYYVTVSNNFGCSTSSDLVTVIVDSSPKVFIGKDTFMYKGQSINLAGSGASSYQWYPADLVTDYLLASTTTKFDQSNTLFLIGIAANGCVDTAKINVEVLPAPFIEVANAFTPNQDGKNDKWVIKFADQLQHIDIKVFDRYGSIVYTFSGNYANDWEGDYKGSALPDADYYYHILYKQTDAMEQQVNGSVTILR